MAKEIKENDIFVASVLQPEMDIDGIDKAGLSVNNTSLLTKDQYRTSGFAEDQFTDKETGQFNEKAFDDFYSKSEVLYNEMASSSFQERLEEGIEYDPLSIMANPDSKFKDVGMEVVKVFNPLHKRKGITMNYYEDSELSVREWAQKGNYMDTKTGEWSKESLNEEGFWETAFGDTKVLAQWDEDGTHIDEFSNSEIKHKKGQYKFNDNGDYYYETIGDREIYGKQTLNPFDVMTVDGSYWNSVDFMDSDGLDKSVVGSTMKMAFKIAPYIIPYVRDVYTPLSTAYGFSTAIPSLYKSIEGILMGDRAYEEQSDFWKTLNGVENFTSKFNSSTSDASKQNMWNYENMSNMVGDVVGQVKEQQYLGNKLNTLINKGKYKKLASLQKLEGEYGKKFSEAALKNDKVALAKTINAWKGEAKAIEENINTTIGRNMTLSYLALTSTKDIYGEAKMAGFDDRTAGLVSLVSSGGLYLVDSKLELGTWMLDDVNVAQRNSLRKSVKKFLKEEGSVIQNGLNKVASNPNASTEARSTLVKSIGKLKGLSEEAWDITKYGGNTWLANSFSEGMEEVTEQVVQDITFGVTNLFSTLGLTEKKGHFDMDFNKDFLNKYLMNFIGGMIGGSVSQIDMMVANKFKPEMPIDQDMFHFIRNGKAHEVYAEIEKQRKKGTLGSTTLSATNFRKDEDGKVVFEQSDSESQDSQNDAIARGLTNYIQSMDTLFEREGIKKSDEFIIENAFKDVDDGILATLKENKLDRWMINDITRITTEIAETRTKMDSLSTKEGNIDEAAKAQLKELTSTYNDLKSEYDAFFDGSKTEEYLSTTMFFLDNNVNKSYLTINKDDFSLAQTGKKYDKLSVNDKAKMDTQYTEYKSSGGLYKNLSASANVFKYFNGKFSGEVSKYEEYFKHRAKYHNSLRRGDLAGAFKNADDKEAFIEEASQTQEGRLSEGFLGVGLSESVGVEFFELLDQYNIIPQELLNQSKNLIGAYEEAFAGLAAKVKSGEMSQADYSKAVNDIESQIKADKNLPLSKYDKNGEPNAEYETDKIRKMSATLYTLYDVVSEGSNLDIADTIARFIFTQKDGGDAISGFGEYEFGVTEEDLNSYDPETYDGKSAEFTSLSRFIENMSGLSISDRSNLKNVLNGVLDKTIKEIKSGNADKEMFYLAEEKINTLISNVQNSIDKFSVDFDSKLIPFDKNIISDIAKQGFANNLSYDEIVKNVIDHLNKVAPEKFINEISELSKRMYDFHSDPHAEKDEQEASLKDYFGEVPEEGELFNKLVERVQKYETQNGLEAKLSEELIKLVENNSNKSINVGSTYESLEKLVEVKQKTISYFTDLKQTSTIKYYESFIEAKNKAKFKENPIFEVLRKLQMDIDNTGVSKTIFDILKEENTTLKSIDKLTSFELDTSIRKGGVDMAKNILDILESVVTASSTNEYVLANGNTEFLGHNNTVKEFLDTYRGGENSEKYGIISSDAATMLMNDVNMLRDKLEFLQELNKINSGNKLKKHEDTLYGYSKLVINTLRNNNFKLKYNGVNLLDGIEQVENINLLSDPKNERMSNKVLQKVEKVIYDNFQNMISTLPDGTTISDVLDEVFVDFKEEFTVFYDQISNSVDNETREVSKYDLFNYLHVVVGVEPESFYGRYKELITSEGFKGKFVPLFVQEMAIRYGVATVENNEVMSHISKFAGDVVLDSSENKANATTLTGVFIDGAGGVGKTSVVAKGIKEITTAKNKAQSTYLVGPNKEVLSNLKGLANEKKADELLDKESFMSKLFLNYSEIKSDFTSEKPTEFFDKSKNFKLTNPEKVQIDKTQLKDLLIIDEITYFDKADLQLLDLLRVDGLPIIMLGDSNQFGHTETNSGGVIVTNNINTCLTCKAPRLNLSLRSSNIWINKNVALTDSFTTKVITFENEKNKEYKFEEQEETLKTLSYFESEEGLIEGHKITKSALNQNFKALSKQNFAIILPDDNTSDAVRDKYEKLLTSNGVEFNDDNFFIGTKIQGQERDYIIIADESYLNANMEDSLKLRQFNTYASRAKVGAIIIDSKGAYAKMKFASNKEFISQAFNFRPESLKNYTDARITDLEEYSTGEGEVIEPTTKTTQGKEEEVKTNDVKKKSEEPDEEPDEKILVPPTNMGDKFDKSEEKSEPSDIKLRTYGFYTRLGIKLSDKGKIDLKTVPKDGTGDILNLSPDKLKGIDTVEKTKKLIKDFSKFKNAMLVGKGVANVGENYYLKQLGISEDVIEGKLNILVREFNSEIDASYDKINDQYNKEYDGRRVASLVYEFGDGYYITISALPNANKVNDIKQVLKDVNEDDVDNLQANYAAFLAEAELEELIPVDNNDLSEITTGLVFAKRFDSDNNDGIRTQYEEVHLKATEIREKYNFANVTFNIFPSDAIAIKEIWKRHSFSDDFYDLKHAANELSEWKKWAGMPYTVIDIGSDEGGQRKFSRIVPLYADSISTNDVLIRAQKIADSRTTQDQEHGKILDGDLRTPLIGAKTGLYMIGAFKQFSQNTENDNFREIFEKFVEDKYYEKGKEYPIFGEDTLTYDFGADGKLKGGEEIGPAFAKPLDNNRIVGWVNHTASKVPNFFSNSKDEKYANPGMVLATWINKNYEGDLKTEIIAGIDEALANNKNKDKKSLRLMANSVLGRVANIVRDDDGVLQTPAIGNEMRDENKQYYYMNRVIESPKGFFNFNSFYNSYESNTSNNTEESLTEEVEEIENTNLGQNDINTIIENKSDWSEFEDFQNTKIVDEYTPLSNKLYKVIYGIIKSEGIVAVESEIIEAYEDEYDLIFDEDSIVATTNDSDFTFKMDILTSIDSILEALGKDSNEVNTDKIKEALLDNKLLKTCD